MPKHSSLYSRRQFLKGGSALLFTLSALPAGPFGRDWLSVTAGLSHSMKGFTDQTFRSQHPRLMLLDDDVPHLQRLVQSDPLAMRYYQIIKASADSLLSKSTVTYNLIGTTPALLQVSEEVLSRVYTLGLVYRLGKDAQYAERARQELLTVAAFRDWNPAHFLDTAEMTHAVGVGYDWFYDTLSDADRTTIQTAIRQMGLDQSVDYYKKHTWWAAVTHNWNLVCNGGMVIGALAIAESDPAFTTQIVQWGLDSAQLAFATYKPDGGWPEGPGYWHYATSYAVYMLAALKSAGVSDNALSQSPGFDQTGLYRTHFVGPTGQNFNFADSGESQSPQGKTPESYWLEQTFKAPVSNWAEQQVAQKSATPTDLIWYGPNMQDPQAANIPTAAFFKGVNVVLMRSAWNDPQALFIGFKGGDNQANHAHLDLGTFVLEGMGQRWAIDLGDDSYDLPDYFGKARYTYYRLKTEGHNTLLIDGTDQAVKAKAPITGFQIASNRTFAIADLTAGYGDKLQRLQRGITLNAGQGILIQDELEAQQPVDVLWAMHTLATITVNGKRATLTQKGVYLHAHLLEPDQGQFEVISAAAPAPQNPNEGVQKLVVRLPDKVTQTRIVVSLVPSTSATPPSDDPKVIPLQSWSV